MINVPMDNTERQRIFAISELLRRAKSTFTENTSLSNGICISLLHDAVEHTLFLTMLKYHCPIPKRADFAQLVSLVADVYRSNASEEMPYQTPLKTLNRLRVSFKHAGTLPSREATIEAMDGGKAYLNDVFERLYKVAIENFDLSDSLRLTPIREQLLLAREKCDNADLLAAAQACAVANWYFESAMSTLFRVDHVPSIRISTGNYRVDEQLQTVAKGLVENLLKSDMSVLSLSLIGSSGIDLVEHARFKLALPNASRTLGGKWYYSWTRSLPKQEPDVCFLISHMTRLTLWLEERFPTLHYDGETWKL